VKSGGITNEQINKMSETWDSQGSDYEGPYYIWGLDRVILLKFIHMSEGLTASIFRVE
jgi:hypothetical protein